MALRLHLRGRRHSGVIRGLATPSSRLAPALVGVFAVFAWQRAKQPAGQQGLENDGIDRGLAAIVAHAHWFAVPWQSIPPPLPPLKRNGLLPVGWTTAPKLTPSITPMNVYVPNGLFVKEPTGTWSVTGSVTGFPLLVLPKAPLT
jgi:hypothetical protein